MHGRTVAAAALVLALATLTVAAAPLVCQLPRQASRSAPSCTPNSPFFAEVAEGARVQFHHGPFRTAPKCIFSEPRSSSESQAAVPSNLLLARDVTPAIRALGSLLGTSALDRGGSCLSERNTGGILVGDVDGDGLPDVFASRLDAPPLLYMNAGDGTFTEEAAARGLHAPGGDCEDDVSHTGSGDAEVPLLARGSNAGALFDADNDGDVDLLVTTIGLHRHAYFVNDGDGRFTEAACQAGLRVTVPYDPSLTSGTSAAVADYDGDGFLDVYVGEWRMHYTRNFSAGADAGHASNSRLLRNMGGHGGPAGTFQDVTDAAGVNMVALSTRLLTQDQLAVPVPEALLREAQLRQQPRPVRTITDGVYTFAPTWADFDGDGWDDLFIAADFMTSVLFWNNGDGTFTEGSREAGLGKDQNGMGVTVADVDHDGRLDIFVSAIHSDRTPSELTGFGTAGNFLYLNRCDGREHRGTPRCVFVDAAEATGTQAGAWSWGAAFVDFDNDADVDLWVANGYLIPESTFDDEWNRTPMRLFENPGWGSHDNAGSGGVAEQRVDVDGLAKDAVATQARWKDVAQELGVADMEPGRGVALLDYDADGDMDVFVASFSGVARLFRNDGANCLSNAFIRVHVVEAASVAGATRDSIGAIVTVASPSTPTQTFRVGSPTKLQGQSEAVVHAGLGAHTTHVDVTVTWQHPTQQLTVHAAPVNTTLRIMRPPQAADDVVAVDSPVLPCEGQPVLKPLRALATNVNLTTPLDGEQAAVGGDGWGPQTIVPGSRLPAAVLTPLGSDHDSDGDKDDASPRIGTDGIAVPISARLEPRKSSTYNLQSLIMAAAAGRVSDEHLPTHSVDGSDNRGPGSTVGATGTPLRRQGPALYTDGVAAPVGAHHDLCTSRPVDGGDAASDADAHARPGARCVSNALFAQRDVIPDPTGLSDLAAHFGQFLAHDLSHVTPQPNSAPSSFFPIPVPRGDPVFDPDGTGTSLLRFRRSGYDFKAHTANASAARLHPNGVTTFVDASAVYGSVMGRQHALRTFSSGALRTANDEASLPVNKDALPNDNPLARRTTALHLAGDVRVNIQPGLLAMHTLFVREHNLIASQLLGFRAAAAGMLTGGAVSPDAMTTLTDAVLFEDARRLVIAEFQAIVYYEYLPAILGEAGRLPPYTGYHPDVDPSITTEFATAAYRFGHSQAAGGLRLVTAKAMAAAEAPGVPRVAQARCSGRRRRNSASQPPCASTNDWYVPLNVTYFEPRWVQRFPEGGIDPLLRGMAIHPAEAVDASAVDELRNHLFGPVGAGGTDLVAVNIQRGRDHGLPAYNDARIAYGLPPHSTFEAITGGNATSSAILRRLYGSVDRLDFFVGGLVEPRHRDSALGETFTTIVAAQFLALRDGDRFYFENTDTRTAEERDSGLPPTPMFDPAQVDVLRDTSMRQLLNRHVHIPPGFASQLHPHSIFKVKHNE